MKKDSILEQGGDDPVDLDALEPEPEKGPRLDLIMDRHQKLKAKERLLGTEVVRVESQAFVKAMEELAEAVRAVGRAVLASAAVPAFVARCGQEIDPDQVGRGAAAVGRGVYAALYGKKARKARRGRKRKAAAKKGKETKP